MPTSPVNALVKLSPSRRRMAQAVIALIDSISISDSKLYNANPPRVFLPIFPTTDDALIAAVLLVKDRCTAVLNPTR